MASGTMTGWYISFTVTLTDPIANLEPKTSVFQNSKQIAICGCRMALI